MLARRFKPASQALLYLNLKHFFELLKSFDLFMQLVLVLFQFDAKQLLSYYDGWMPGSLSTDSLQWAPLGPIGSFDLKYPDYLNAVKPCSSRIPDLTARNNAGTCGRHLPHGIACGVVSDVCIVWALLWGHVDKCAHM
jgi:hypothetical protein